MKHYGIPSKHGKRYPGGVRREGGSGHGDRSTQFGNEKVVSCGSVASLGKLKGGEPKGEWMIFAN